MKILVINCGSSSIKFQLFEMPGSDTLTKGVIEKIGQHDSLIIIQRNGEQDVNLKIEILSHQDGIDFLLKYITDLDHGCLKSLKDLDAVGHRIGHGGEKHRNSIIINETILSEIEKYNELAPLHNPHNLIGIRAIQKHLPTIKQVAVFDTSFHQTLPDYAYMYAIPYSLYEKYKIRRYGFHGPSHQYVSERACKLLNIDIKQQKIITCHLGNGSSIAAIDKGKSIDTSMGFTPLEGLIMGTRPGDVDAGIVTYLLKKEGMGSDSLNAMFYKESGLLGITCISSDMRKIEEASNTSKKAKLGLEMFYYRIKKYIGAYAAVLNGLDILIFTGGIGEKSVKTREEVCKNLNFLGIKIDKVSNENPQDSEKVISTTDSKVTVIVVLTNEELIIAQETQQLISDHHQSRN